MRIARKYFNAFINLLYLQNDHCRYIIACSYFHGNFCEAHSSETTPLASSSNYINCRELQKLISTQANNRYRSTSIDIRS